MNPLSLTEMNELIVKFYPALEHYAVRLIWKHHQRVLEPGDLVNMTVVTIVSKKHLFIRGSSFPNWALTIMHHAMVDYIKSQHTVRRKNGFKFVEENAAYDVAAVDDPSIGLTIRDFIRAFARLSPRTQKFIMMSYGEITWEQIARDEGIPVGTVRSRISRGKHKLREVDL